MKKDTIYILTPYSNALVPQGSTSDTDAAVLIQNKPITKLLRLIFDRDIAAAAAAVLIPKQRC